MQALASRMKWLQWKPGSWLRPDFACDCLCYSCQLCFCWKWNPRCGCLKTSSPSSCSSSCSCRWLTHALYQAWTDTLEVLEELGCDTRIEFFRKVSLKRLRDSSSGTRESAGRVHISQLRKESRQARDARLLKGVFVSRNRGGPPESTRQLGSAGAYGRWNY